MDGEMTGLSDERICQRFGLLKGRVCEAIVEELFTALGYEVHRFGIENAIPSFVVAIRAARESGDSKWNETLTGSSSMWKVRETWSLRLG